jgi:hypothetical protein
MVPASASKLLSRHSASTPFDNSFNYKCRYLKATRDKGMILRPSNDKDMEIYVDANFAGNWDSNETWDRDTDRSRHGYIVSYAGCPIIWKSQLQTEIALSSTESEYTGLSYALRDAIPMMELLKEMKKLKFPIRSTTPQVHFKVFEEPWKSGLPNCTTLLCTTRTPHDPKASSGH